MVQAFGLHSTKDGITKLPHHRTCLPKFPSPKVHCLPGIYPKTLGMAQAAGILEWSEVALESPLYSKLTDSLTMTSFVVTKDKNRDRLICRPRVQLPNPSLFTRMRIQTDVAVGDFYFDVSNMFHSIILPKFLLLFSIAGSPLRKPATGSSKAAGQAFSTKA